ncbi:MAG: YfhO family protein [Bacteroidetes bacterium]|nr:YfhO family protein [Bacteroidota bacterium]
MPKEKKSKKDKQKTRSNFINSFNFDEFIPKKYHTLAVTLTIIILFLIFFNPLYFGGKTFQSGDIIASKSLHSYVENHTDGFTLWNPHIFCGIPAYATSTGARWFNLFYDGITAVRSAFSAFFEVEYAMWSFYLIILGITSFFFMKYLTKNTLVSLFTAVSTAFSTGLIVFLFIGHVTKLTSICWYPLIFLFILRLQKKITLIDILLLIITLQLFIQGFHVQIIFYTLLSVGIYFIYYLIRALFKKNKELRQKVLKTVGAFTFSFIIALLIQSDNFTQVYEYMPYSTRGSESILEKTMEQTTKSESDYYNYHTSWSFSPEEVVTFIVPSFYGFGNSTYKGKLTQGKPVEVNTYFGQMPFVDVAMYMGVLVFFLALFAMFSRWKEPFIQFLTILSIFALILSFGKNFSPLFDLFFYYFPFFDKFRVPSMVLVLMQLSFPVLAGLGIMKIISLREEKNDKLIKLLRNISIVFTTLFVISILFNSVITDWFVSRVNNFVGFISSSRPQYAQQFSALAGYMGDMFSGDLMIAMGMLTLTFGGAYAYVNSKLSRDIWVVLLITLTLFDLWRIADRGAQYKDNPDITNQFNPPDYITAIKNRNDKEPFRIFNLKQDGSLGSFRNNSNYNTYFLVEDFYGYSAIKPRTFQDYMDVVGPVNETMWNMLNVKYIITDKPFQLAGLLSVYKENNTYIYENTNSLPRVYLVDSVSYKKGIDILNSVKSNSFDPKIIAFVNDENLRIDKPDSSAFSKIIEYKDESVKLEVNATGNNFLFFGNTYLPTGWKVFIDNNESKLYKVNYGFMGAVIPNGKHLVEFKYAPTTFYIAKYVVLILSLLVILSLIFSLWRRKKSIISKEDSY